MRTLSAFTQMTLDGYYADPNGDLSWAHRPADDAESDVRSASRRKRPLPLGQ